MSSPSSAAAAHACFFKTTVVAANTAVVFIFYIDVIAVIITADAYTAAAGRSWSGGVGVRGPRMASHIPIPFLILGLLISFLGDSIHVVSG